MQALHSTCPSTPLATPAGACAWRTCVPSLPPPSAPSECPLPEGVPPPSSWHPSPLGCCRRVRLLCSPLVLVTPQALEWRDRALYETEVKPLQRFLVDTPCCGGAWLLVPGGAWQPVAAAQRLSGCDVEARAEWTAAVCLTPDATQLADTGWSPFDAGAAGQPSGGGGGGGGGAGAPSPKALQAAAAARRGDIAPLRYLVLDVVSATADGRDRWVMTA